MSNVPLLPNFFAGRWQLGQGHPITLRDPVLGTEIAQVTHEGIDLAQGFEYARRIGGQHLRALTYTQRGELLRKIVEVLNKNKPAYYDIATANSGTTVKDSAVDIEGSLFTLSTYAKLSEQLGQKQYLVDGERARLGKELSFQSQHILLPTPGVALFINAFNFPAWGLWEKAAPALLSGVPIIVKPATATAWLTQKMVQDVIDTDILPAGALSILCGSSKGLLDQLQPFDVVSFTGSAQTAQTIRCHPAVSTLSVRCNIEADSLNSALLDPHTTADSDVFNLLVSEVVREMTVKSGQKCTAIRRIFVPHALYPAVAKALREKLKKITVGNPRDDTVRMGSLVSQEQYQSVVAGIEALKKETEVLFDGNPATLIQADPQTAACIAPVLLGLQNMPPSSQVNHTEVFGPVATLIAYQHIDQAYELIESAQGSLVMSVYSDRPEFIAQTALKLGPYHGRIHAISPEVATLHTGHGNVMPVSIHGGPGRAGGGEELGGLRALHFYHRRVAIQSSLSALDLLTGEHLPY